ncbi:hypothetical protein GQ54DRAFT_311030 [Martensiomyces pterosporus]|nr:hypothetical protein GQ54DRAFT_311030 [Martensiomyces pterosporus]
MLSLARHQLARQIGARAFSARAIYVANLHPETSEEKLRGVFGKYGAINGVRIGAGRENYRYAHIYYGAGQVPVEGDLTLYMRDQEPTPEETNEVESATAKAVEESQGLEIDGNVLVVRQAIYKQPGQQRSNQGQRSERDSGSAFNRGYALGYRQGVTDGRSMRD